MARRWKWYSRRGRVDVPGPSDRVDDSAGDPTTAAPPNETGVHDRPPAERVDRYRARAASWRWPE